MIKNGDESHLFTDIIQLWDNGKCFCVQSIGVGESSLENGSLCHLLQLIKT